MAQELNKPCTGHWCCGNLQLACITNIWEPPESCL